MAYYEDGGLVGPRQRSLVDALRGGTATGTGGPLAPSAAPGAPGAARAGLVWGNVTPEESARTMSAQTGLLGQQHIAADKDAAYLGSIGGVPPADWRPEISRLPTGIDIRTLMGRAPDVDNTGGETPAGAGAGSAAPAGLDFSRLTGYDQGKFDANKQDAKYQMGRTLSQFDPRQGLTPDVIAALNQLGYGTFSGSGDKLSLSGLTDTGKQNGLVGDYQDADVNVGFKSGNGKWGYADPAYEAQHPQSGGAPQMGGGSSLTPMLQGDASSGIAQALQNIGALNQPSRIQQLIAALGGR